jgi:hypothetical protein
LLLLLLFGIAVCLPSYKQNKNNFIFLKKVIIITFFVAVAAVVALKRG